eukprot:c12327_g1_i3.p1 GENE.c12327_g1_i3~~c12327_g1_i3.p1  ORF type:complete len:851 (-),score=232.50 c12327_g1_i3:423-2975(-)
MRACTAVLIELQYETSSNPLAKYRGEVEFMDEQEWIGEMGDLLGDLTQQDGHAILSEPAPNAYNYTSWCKLYAVYGDDFTHSRYATGEQRNGRAVYKSLKVEDLKAKLIGIRTVTQHLGTTKVISANDPNSFRRQLNKYVDSANEISAGSCWPIVKRVRLFSQWDILRSGTILVDAPGLNDDNSSRDKIVKSYLKSADSVWIVSNINRAVNDKTAKDMLDANFRQQLLMDGSYGSLVFIATQSDVIQRTEVIKSLGLSELASVRECALARNAFTKQRILSDFYEGLQEMSITAGETPPSREELEIRFRLPTFCVSSLDYQKLASIRKLDGNASVWQHVQDTQLPGLIQHVHYDTLATRRRIVRARVDALMQFGLSLISFTRPGEELPSDVREEAEASFQELSSHLPDALGESIDAVKEKLKTQFSTQIAPKLSTGSDLAEAKAVETAQSWHALHWATYRACCRRKGAWRIDMNTELANPILNTISTSWERVFANELKSVLVTATNNVKEQLGKFHEELTGALMRLGVPRDRLNGLLELLRDSAASKVSASLQQITAQVQAEQKELSRSIAPAIQNIMDPAYAAGYDECGTGSHVRRKAIMDGHVEKKKNTMFKHTIKPILDSLDSIHHKIFKSLRKCSEELIDEVRLNYSFVWEAASPATMNARAQMQPTLTKATAKVQAALSQLLLCQGLSQGEIEQALGPSVVVVDSKSVPKPLPVLPRIKVETPPPSAMVPADSDELEVVAEPAASELSSSASSTAQQQTSAAAPVPEGEIQLVSIKGSLATMDFPHARFNCVRFAFGDVQHCDKCFCYVCDVLASECQQWAMHCVAKADSRHWRDERAKRKLIAKK